MTRGSAGKKEFRKEMRPNGSPWEKKERIRSSLSQHTGRKGGEEGADRSSEGWSGESGDELCGKKVAARHFRKIANVKEGVSGTQVLWSRTG